MAGGVFGGRASGNGDNRHRILLALTTIAYAWRRRENTLENNFLEPSSPAAIDSYKRGSVCFAGLAEITQPRKEGLKGQRIVPALLSICCHLCNQNTLHSARFR